MTDAIAANEDFSGRGELETLLDDVLPAGWADAARAGDAATVETLKATVHNPSVVHALGAAGWVAPHYAPEHGGRGLTRDDARRALTLLNRWDVPHVPRGSGLALKQGRRHRTGR